MNVAGLNTHFAPFGINDTGAIGTDKSGLGLALEGINDLLYAPVRLLGSKNMPVEREISEQEPKRTKLAGANGCSYLHELHLVVECLR